MLNMLSHLTVESLCKLYPEVFKVSPNWQLRHLGGPAEVTSTASECEPFPTLVIHNEPGAN